MRFAQMLSEQDTGRSRPMPVDAPPVGPAKARSLRLQQLRERLAEPGPHVDVDAVATSIARRALFTEQLTAQLVEEAEAEGVFAARREAV